MGPQINLIQKLYCNLAQLNNNIVIMNICYCRRNQNKIQQVPHWTNMLNTLGIRSITHDVLLAQCARLLISDNVALAFAAAEIYMGRVGHLFFFYFEDCSFFTKKEQFNLFCSFRSVLGDLFLIIAITFL